MSLTASMAKELADPEKVAQSAIDGPISDAVRVEAMRGKKTALISLSAYPDNIQNVIKGKLLGLGFKVAVEATGNFTVSW